MGTLLKYIFDDSISPYSRVKRAPKKVAPRPQALSSLSRCWARRFAPPTQVTQARKISEAHEGVAFFRGPFNLARVSSFPTKGNRFAAKEDGSLWAFHLFRENLRRSAASAFRKKNVVPYDLVPNSTPQV